MSTHKQTEKQEEQQKRAKQEFEARQRDKNQPGFREQPVFEQRPVVEKMPVFEGVHGTEDQKLVEEAIPRITQTTEVPLGPDGMPLKRVAHEAGRRVSREEVEAINEGETHHRAEKK